MVKLNKWEHLKYFLEKPANQYISEFIRDIDRSKILQAEHIMIRPHGLLSLKDGLNVAIKTMQENGLSSVSVTIERDTSKVLLLLMVQLKV